MQLCMSIEEATRKLLLSVAGSARLFKRAGGCPERRTEPHRSRPVVPKENPKTLIFYARWDHASTGEMSRVRAVVDTKKQRQLEYDGSLRTCAESKAAMFTHKRLESIPYLVTGITEGRFPVLV